MNDKKNGFLRVQVDSKMEQAFKQILDIKGSTIQSVLETLVKNYIFENLDCIMNNNARK